MTNNVYYDVDEHIRRLKDLIEKYPQMFSEEIINKLFKEFKNFEYNYNFTAEELRGVYDELGLIPDELNIYLGFIKLIKDNFDLDGKRVLEVGGGILPRLGERMCSSTSIGKITVYDPELSVVKEGNNKLVLVREKFTEDTNLDDVDLVIALMPCEATMPIVKAATKNNVDFMIGLCEGGTEFSKYESDDAWISAVKYTASRGMEEHDMGSLKEESLLQYNDIYPVIYNKRRVR